MRLGDFWKIESFKILFLDLIYFIIILLLKGRIVLIRNIISMEFPHLDQGEFNHRQLYWNKEIGITEGIINKINKKRTELYQKYYTLYEAEEILREDEKQRKIKK